MPLTAPTQVTESWFRNTLIPFINTIEGNVTSLLSRMTATETAVSQKYTKPAAGIPVSDLVSTGLVQTDGTVLRAVKLTQAQYDALTPKVATTLYVVTV